MQDKKKANSENKKPDAAEKVIENKTEETSENISKVEDYKHNVSECCLDAKNLFDKKVLTSCVLSVIISVSCVFIVMKSEMKASNQKIQEVISNYGALDNKVKNVKELVTSLESSVSSIKDEFKLSKETSTHIYSGIAALQKDIDTIKKEFHIKDSDIVDDSIKKLSSDKQSFINSFENLIMNGTPFNSFLESYSEKIDVKKYSKLNALLKFSDLEIKSISDLKKDYSTVGLDAFEVVLNESFWEKQKRIIKEKIVDAIKIKKTDEKAEAIDISLNDKEMFSKASQLISDGNVANSLQLLEKIKTKNKKLDELIADVKKRSEVNAAFYEFKKEFIETESKN